MEDAPQRRRCSVTLITLNEERNVRACLESVAWADEIVVVDSGSQDRTVEIAKEFTNQVFFNPWPGWKAQKNHAISRAAHDWIFSIDADERVTPELRERILEVLAEPRHAGYSFPRKNFFLGKWMSHGGWHPDAVLRLFRKDAGKFGGLDPHDRVFLSAGSEGYIPIPIVHYTYMSFKQYAGKQLPYADAAARESLNAGKRASTANIFLKPFWKFFEVYLIKRGLLDGAHGLIAAMGSSYTTYLKQARMWEIQREKNEEAAGRSATRS